MTFCMMFNMMTSTVDWKIQIRSRRWRPKYVHIYKNKNKSIGLGDVIKRNKPKFCASLSSLLVMTSSVRSFEIILAHQYPTKKTLYPAEHPYPNEIRSPTTFCWVLNAKEIVFESHNFFGKLETYYLNTIINIVTLTNI